MLPLERNKIPSFLTSPLWKDHLQMKLQMLTRECRDPLIHVDASMQVCYECS